MQQVETNGWNHEQVHGCDLRMVAQEGALALTRRPAVWAGHVLGHGRLRDRKAELEQLAMKHPKAYSQCSFDGSAPVDPHRLVAGLPGSGISSANTAETSLKPADRPERRNQQPQKEEEQRNHRGRRDSFTRSKGRGFRHTQRPGGSIKSPPAPPAEPINEGSQDDEEDDLGNVHFRLLRGFSGAGWHGPRRQIEPAIQRDAIARGSRAG